ncbi:P12 family lipoprotein [Borrelia puertoricensis]|uniref:P12 family lipoprotein n=1 Tax=Borrelia puertoricensis TaxID=2756107 RepID=UPI001FF6AE0D|nr:P12 family lipoprotein [Borrelia puertoricensis]UPA19049.1 P12 family lipoprotein [Borrelia puertoricensis]
MKRSILSVCILALLCLLSCDINALNDLLSEVREKFLDESKDNKYLNHEQGNQEQKEVVIDLLEEGVDIQQDMGVRPVNAEFEVFRQEYPYYSQEEIEIKEEDLTPSTESEKEADKAIKGVENTLKNSGFPLLMSAYNLKNEYEQMRTELYYVTKRIQDEIGLLRGTGFKGKRQNLNRLQGCLRGEIFNSEDLMNKIDIAIGELESAKYFFEEAQKTLKEAITERLRSKKRRSYSSRGSNSDFLTRKARSDAENVSSLLESSSSRIGEAMGIKKEIEEVINEAKSVLGSLSG